MKNMREMINLMEGVMAVPGLKTVRENESDMQTAGTVGRNQDYADFDASQEMATESVPAVDSCQQSNPANADVACAMEGMGERSEAVAQALSDFQNMVMNGFAEPETAYNRIAAELDPDSLAEFDNALEQEGLMSYGDDVDTGMGGIDDMSDDADALASAGHGSDEDYGSASDMEFEEAFDLNNGYDDVNDASGNDYFPNGADSPVVSKVGPSGARQGDNPEQKKMQIAEVHKELVYSYRSFLGESAKPKKKVN